VKSKQNYNDPLRIWQDDYEEEILNQSGISLLMKEHQNGLEFRILSVDMEELLAAAAKKKEDHLKGSNKKKRPRG